ncbi:hypothetical protein, partial [Paenibacillus thiaminolyticus]|uniref:hypothetical protein n=1 Tax=Paenibacillus thiaminolyticus TaxID=49283 RepID=UPI0022807190
RVYHGFFFTYEQYPNHAGSGDESLSAPLKSIIPLAQEAVCIMGFSSLMNNIPITQEVEMNRCLPRLRALSP